MEIKNEIISMLELMPQPAFLVQAGQICRTNAAAGIYLIKENTAIDDLIADAQEDYAAFTNGTLYLTLRLAGIRLGAAVTRLEDVDLFTLEQSTEQAQLQALALAAKQLRGPMTAMLSAANRLAPNITREGMEAAAQANRRAHQLLRMICNMSDAMHYSQPESGWMEYMEMCSFFEEILEKAAYHGEKVGISVRWELPNASVCTMADREKLERALLNLLSNAMKFSAEGSEILVRLIQRENRLHLSVTAASDKAPAADIYTKFQRQPMLEDSRLGIGLGMVLVRATASAHGGTVLVDQPDIGHSRVTLTIPIRPPQGDRLRSPVMHMDYAGEWDHCLLELSEVLPFELYSTENIQ